MTYQPNDGGPAFPTENTATTLRQLEDGRTIYTHYGSQNGMTLRDYFAAAVLQGSIACPDSSEDWDGLARDAYKYADAMLRAREPKP